MKFPSLSPGTGCMGFMAVILAIPAAYARTKDVDLSTENIVLGHQRFNREPHASGNTSRFIETTVISSVVEPTTGCEDTTLEFPIGTENRNCAWVAEDWRQRCKLLRGQVRKFCPETCGKCDKLACKDPSKPFYVGIDTKTCRWVRRKRDSRCQIEGVTSTCRLTCNEVCTWPVVKFVGNPCTDTFESGQCEACTGDCDNDGDCAGDLRCAQRYASYPNTVENIPGCRWGDSSGPLQAGKDDYCFMPESIPGEINYIGECNGGGGNDVYLCGECEGDCDDDSDCADGLECFQRSGAEIVPGCSGAGGKRDVYAKDICYKPKVSEVELVGNPCNDFFDSGFCEVCTGDCDRDSDCEGDLRCAQRSGGADQVENVPGCTWAEGSEDLQSGDDDFCFMPESTPGEINYIGECGEGNGYLCGKCEGDCDSDDDCEEGLLCVKRSGFEDVTGCSGAGGERDVYAKDICYSPNPVEYIDSLRATGDGTRCAGPCNTDNDCDGALQCFQRDDSEYVPGCVTGGVGDISGMNYCHRAPPNGNPTYIPGMLTVNDIENGLELSKGLSARLIASAGQVVEYVNGGSSLEVFHYKPDGAAVFNVTSGENAGGWIYASNSEVTDGGGVGAITFDPDGNVINYERIVVDTKRNCGGGKTYWGTWVTCEEDGSSGQVWEVDPAVGLPTQQKTKIGGTGGNYESFAYDVRDRLNPKFYVTHDASTGGTVRFTPDAQTVQEAEDSGDYSNVLTTEGTLEWLVLSPENDNKEDRRGTFHWSNSRSEGDSNASQFYRYAEGIDIRNGFLYMTTKADKYLFILDLDNLTYERSSTVSGAFEGQPDQIASIVAGNPARDMLYFCEESSPINNGVHARDIDGNFYTILNGPGIRGETTGLDFSPDNTRMYVSYQGPGLIFEITRDDGYPFGAHRLDIKYHAD